MSVTQSLGEIRPICPISDALDLHQLNKALITAEAVACLLDSAVRQPANVSRERLRVMADSLRSAAGSLDAAGRSTTAGVLS